MKLAIMQPYIFPYIGYFQLINAADRFVILDDVNYINKGWINRNNILVNGKANMFTIPLKDASQNKLINEITVSDDAKWQAKFLRTIELNYKKAPCYDNVYPVIAEILNSGIHKIADLNYYSITRINEYLGIHTMIVSTSSVYQNAGLKGQDRIIDICIKEKATDYINPIGGVELYSKEAFGKNNLNIQFIKTGTIVYEQFKHEFIPWLSIIDVMMFNSPEVIKDILNQYEFI